MGLVRIISAFGSAALAGNTIGIRIFLFGLLPSWGVSNAAVTLVGQNLGAGHPERAEESAWKICIYNTACLVSIGVVFLFFAPLLVSAFTAQSASAVAGTTGTAPAGTGYTGNLSIEGGQTLLHSVISGVNVDISPREAFPFPLIKFVPWAAYAHLRDGRSFLLEQHELSEALRSQPVENPDRLSFDESIQRMAGAEEIRLPVD